jgi:hypothetical protein
MQYFSIEYLKEQNKEQELYNQLLCQVAQQLETNTLEQLKKKHFELLQQFRNLGIFDLEMEIQHKIIEFNECPICLRTYDQLYPSNNIAVVTTCICVVCKDCLRNWFKNSDRCTKQTKICPICFKIVKFSTDSRNNHAAKQPPNNEPFLCDLSELFSVYINE